MNLFDLFVRIGVEDEASEKISEITGKIGNGLKNAAKIGVAAVGAASTGIVALTKNAIENYAEYEQLVGGVDTLFKESSQRLQEYAANAYKTAGISANEYMSNVTSFSAALINSVGGDTEKAADIANRAITDMADNANKMGTSMDVIIQTYQSISRGNFAMLDNLKLGYGGTKAELERLLEDAEAYKATMGETADYSINSFSDIVEAIGVVQEKMGIFGATAQEAEGTITGSIASMQAAWQNLVTGLADPKQDLGVLMGNFVDSVVTVGENIIPRIQETLPRVVDGIIQLIDTLIPYLPGIIESLLPTLITGAVNLIRTITTELFPQVLNLGVNLLSELGDGIETGLPEFVSRLPQIIEGFVLFFSENLPTIIQQGTEILLSFIEGITGAIPELVSALPVIINTLVQFFTENAPIIVSAGFQIITALVMGLLSAIPEIIKSIPQIVSSVVGAFQSFSGTYRDIGKNIVTGLWDGIVSMASWIKDKVSGFVGGIVSNVKGVLGIASPSKVFADIGGFMAEGLAEGWDSGYNDIKKNIGNDLNFGIKTTAAPISSTGNGGGIGETLTIIVQSVLDGKIIGETAYKYGQNRERAFGGAY